MSSSDRPGELSLFGDAPPESAEASIPFWRPSLADGWSRKAPSRRTVEAQGPDLLCRGTEFLEAVRGAPVEPDDARVQRFREHQEELARELVGWPDVEAGDDEAADAARRVEGTVDQLETLRRRILRDLDAKARTRVLAAERRASSDDRLVQRIRALADFLLAEAQGEVVEVRLSPSFLTPSATPAPSSIPEPRSDVRRALEDAFPDGVLEPLWFHDSWLADAWTHLRKALAELHHTALLHERPPLEPMDWSLVIDDEMDEDDEDELPAWEETEWDDQERSYGIFFVGPEGEPFRFDFDSEWPDEEGFLQPVEGVGRIGWVVAVSAVAPFALLRVRSLDTEDDIVLPPDIEQRVFDERGRPQSEALFLREMLDEGENRTLDDLRERIVEVLREHDVTTLSEEEMAVPVPWLEASDEVLVAKGPEAFVSVEDGLFFRWI